MKTTKTLQTLQEIKRLSMHEAREIGGVLFGEWCDMVLGPKVEHTITGISIKYASERVKNYLSSM